VTKLSAFAPSWTQSLGMTPSPFNTFGLKN
jgi:hypothetical protein